MGYNRERSKEEDQERQGKAGRQRTINVSSAFDSVDHSILLQRLSTSFGLTDKPLEWLCSFLSERTNCVTFGSSRSAWVLAPFGVPQGSVLGPLLYIIYTADIGALLSSHGSAICR